MPPTPAELSDLLALVADQSRIAEQVGRVAEALDEQSRELTVLRSVINSMVEDRHVHLIPALEDVVRTTERLRDEVKEALKANAEACQTRRDKLDRVVDEIRMRGARQDAIAKQPSGEVAKDGLAFTWSQKISGPTVLKWLAWAVATAGAFLGGQYRSSLSKPPSISAPALPAPPAQKGTP